MEKNEVNKHMRLTKLIAGRVVQVHLNLDEIELLNFSNELCRTMICMEKQDLPTPGVV